MIDFPALAPEFIAPPTVEQFAPLAADHPPRFLLLYGSLRPRSFSRLLIEEADRLLRSLWRGNPRLRSAWASPGGRRRS